MNTVKVKVLRTFQHSDIYATKGQSNVELPQDLAEQLAKGKKPAVEIIKAK